MTDDLDEALASLTPEHPVLTRNNGDGTGTKLELLPPEEGLVPVANRLLSLLADQQLQYLDMRKAPDRNDAVEAYELLTSLANVISAKARIIRNVMTRFMVENGTKKLYVDLPTGRASVSYTPPKNAYVVSGNDGAAMHKELTALVESGVVTEDEVEAAVRPVISYQVNHTHLNKLVNRSEQAAEIVARYRHLEERDPLTGHVAFPGG